MSWDPYYQGKRTIVYVSPLVAVLCAVAVLLAVTYPFLRGWLTHFTPAPAASLRGEWVGHLDVSGIRDPWARDMRKGAVVRFKLGLTDSILKKYGGDGEITVAGEAARSIRVKDLWPNTPSDGEHGAQKFSVGIWVQPYHAAPNDLISGGFHGTFQAGTLTLVRDSGQGFEMAGSLKKGTDADYKALKQEMNAKSQE